ncbi:DUF3313 domain-containing protein [Trinickia mobilis]|uniref:DUF3313 domain-containing protein n=1 Tax=Trinickia mobilis TaxID=2816356 RepID=UPI001A9093CE|nr:DUF3313 domain-containing protein [Trinickia mobilis]
MRIGEYVLARAGGTESEAMMKSICPLLAMIALAACAVTTQQPLSDIEKAPKSGFLSDYSLLQPGKEGQVRLRYVNPNTNWNSYTGIFIEPVAFITDADAHVDPKDEQVLSTYYYNTLKTHLSEVLPIVEQPGPQVLVVRAALTKVTTATPGLRTFSVVIPQARLLNAAQSVATDSYAFVGSAQSEGEIKDGGTGQILAEAVDGRAGGMSIKNAGVWKWGDAENVMDYWAELTAKRLKEFRSGTPAS